MINVITDLLQSAGLILWVVLTILLTRRVNRLDKRVDNRIYLHDSGYYHDAHGGIIYKAPDPDPKPICGCGHHQCFHDETGCGKTDDWSRFSSGNNVEHQLVPCGCKGYMGPEQLPTVIP